MKFSVLVAQTELVPSFVPSRAPLSRSFGQSTFVPNARTSFRQDSACLGLAEGDGVEAGEGECIRPSRLLGD